jgi:hypothetical protein
VADPVVYRKGMAEWVKWLVPILASALLTSGLWVWLLAARLTGIDDHLGRLDAGQQAIMSQHQVLSDQIYSMDQRAIIIDTFLHDQFPDKIPLPATGVHDGFDMQK